MKKALLTVGLLSTLVFAQQVSSSTQSAYVGAGAGILAGSKDVDAGLGLSVRGGISLPSTIKGMGVQVELNKSVIDPKFKSFAKYDVTTLAAYTTYDIAINDSGFSLRPKIGVILPNLGDDIDSRDLILSSGFGATYKVQNNMHLYADYTVLGSAISNYSAGVEFSF